MTGAAGLLGYVFGLAAGLYFIFIVGRLGYRKVRG
jgi:hypothetical protein